MKILDVGCGPGSITIDFAKYVTLGHVVGMDTEAAAATLAKARAQAVKEGMHNVEFLSGDALALPFPDNSFDVVHSHQVIQYVDNPVLFFEEMRWVVKPGGYVACHSCDTGTTVIQPQPQYRKLEKLEQLCNRVLEESGRSLKAARSMHIWARKAGFNPARFKLTTSNYVFRTLEERRYWGTMAVGIVRESAMMTAAVKKGYITAEEVTEGLHMGTLDSRRGRVVRDS